MANSKDIPVGTKFNKLTLLRNTAGKIGKDKKLKKMAVFMCDCGNETECLVQSVKRGVTKSCGCLKHKYKDIGERASYKEILYRFNGMMSRCYNTNDKFYNDYGGRGIDVCEKWRGNFRAFYEWALLSNYKRGLEIDREDNNIGYSPNNCRWVTRIENARNTRVNIVIEVAGVKKLLLEWAEITGIKYKTLKTRYYRGWDSKRIIANKCVK